MRDGDGRPVDRSVPQLAAHAVRVVALLEKMERQCEPEEGVQHVQLPQKVDQGLAVRA